MNGISVVVTERDDLGGVLDLIGMLAVQTRPPSELVVVDGGSCEDELARFEQSLAKVPFGVKLLRYEGCNISQGRNMGIQSVDNDVVAVTDCGCKLELDWLEKLIEPFEHDENVDLVAGWYLPDAQTNFERVLAAMTLLTLRNVDDETFIPSSRSLAFKKQLWTQVGGYPDHLYTAEDTVFYMKARGLSNKAVVARDAVVRWRPRSTLKGVFRQYFKYSRGDGNELLFAVRYVSRMMVYSVLICAVVWTLMSSNVYPLVAVLSVYFLYVSRYVSRASKTSVSFTRRVYIALLIVEIMDFSSILGYLYGLVDRMMGRVKKGRIF